MMQKLSKFIKNQDISIRIFEQKIADNYPPLNIEWLIIGKGLWSTATEISEKIINKHNKKNAQEELQSHGKSD
jgi:hypothetical protein